jgi:hypothetical protein
MLVRKLKIKNFLHLISLTSVIAWGIFSTSQVYALTQDFSTNSSNNLSEANLKSFSNGEISEEELEQIEEKPPEATIDLQLYQANTPVADSSEAERYPAFSKILQKILIRISGNTKVNELFPIKSALKNAENLIDQFSYVRTPSFELNAHFNPEQVNALLKKAGQPIFNKKRPSIVIWLVIRETDGNTHLVGSISEDTLGQDWEKTLHDSANTLSLPIVFPFGDIDDLSTISEKNLWNITPKTLIEASERYGTANILVLKMQTEKTNPCVTEWAFRPEGKHTIHWNENAKTCQVALDAGITKTLHDVFLFPTQKDTSQKAAPLPEPTQIIHLSIFHIQSAEDYQLILNDLQSQPGIMSVDIDKVTPVEVSYELHIKGNLNDIMNILATHQELQFLKKGADRNSIEYEFVGRPSANVWESEQQ